MNMQFLKRHIIHWSVSPSMHRCVSLALVSVLCRNLRIGLSAMTTSRSVGFMALPAPESQLLHTRSLSDVGRSSQRVSFFLEAKVVAVPSPAYCLPWHINSLYTNRHYGH